MAQKITAGAVLSCNKGSETAKLKVNSQDYYFVDEKLAATEADKKSEVNIASFGNCSISKSKCSPRVMNWEEPAKKDTVNDLKLLTDKSFCQCLVGGKITVLKRGFKEIHHLE